MRFQTNTTDIHNTQRFQRAYSPLVSLNKALLNPYFWGGGYVRGGWLTSHEIVIFLANLLVIIQYIFTFLSYCFFLDLLSDCRLASQYVFFFLSQNWEAIIGAPDKTTPKISYTSMMPIGAWVYPWPRGK